MAALNSAAESPLGDGPSDRRRGAVGGGRRRSGGRGGLSLFDVGDLAFQRGHARGERLVGGAGVGLGLVALVEFDIGGVQVAIDLAQRRFQVADAGGEFVGARLQRHRLRIGLDQVRRRLVGLHPRNGVLQPLDGALQPVEALLVPLDAGRGLTLGGRGRTVVLAERRGGGADCEQQGAREPKKNGPRKNALGNHGLTIHAISARMRRETAQGKGLRRCLVAGP